MRLKHAASAINALPAMLKSYGISDEEVLKIHFDPTTNTDVKLSVQLSKEESIKMLGDPEVEVSYEGDFVWTKYYLVKDSIAFVCRDFVIEHLEHEAIA